MRTKRPELSTATQETINKVIERQVKNLKTFTVDELVSKVRQSLHYTESDTTRAIALSDDVNSVIYALQSSGKVLLNDGTYTLVVGKRGRPAKIKVQQQTA